MFDTPFIIPVVAIVCWAVVSIVRARHGIADPDWTGKQAANPPMFRKLLEKAMAERDSELQNLRERIIVLEKIVTDSHQRHSLSDEIDRLRNQDR